MRQTASILIIGFLSLVSLVVPAANATVDTEAPAGQVPPTQELPQAVAALLGAAHDPGNRTAVTEALRLNAFRDEWTPGLAPVPPRFRGPDPVLRHPRVVCDVDKDGHEDILVTEQFGASIAKMVSGKDGGPIWVRGEIDFAVANEFRRVTTVAPRYPENVFATVDANGDGSCDVLTLSVNGDGIDVPPILSTVQLARATVTLRLLNGADGEPLWSREFQMVETRTNTPPPVGQMGQTRVVRGLVTGIEYVPTDDGGRFVVKTTDITWARARTPPFVPPQEAFSYTIVEQVHLGDIKSGANVWTRELQSDANNTHYTWITGAAQLLGSAEPEIVLDRLSIRNPRSNEMTNPLTGGPLFQYGRSMSVFALRGESGATAWEVTILDETAFRPNLPLEEEFPVIQWTLAQIMPDLTGDDVPDPMASFFAVEAGQPRSINGRFLTHFKAIDGVTGRKIGGEADIRVQGWGFAHPLRAGTDGKGLIALGTIDAPTRPQAGGAFPTKDVRLTVVNVTDGTSRWQYTERFAQDTYLSYQLSLRQMRDTLAIEDVDGDQIRDLVTPARYVALGRDQVLLSTQRHEYRILSGRDGSVLRTFTAWGGNGFALDCVDDHFVSVSGASRRVDLTKTPLHDEAEAKVLHLWTDTTVPRAATAGANVAFMDAQCTITSGNATFYFVNIGLVSQQRGTEVLSLQGVADASGNITWARPVAPSNAQVLGYIDLLQEPWPPESDLDVAGAIGGVSFVGGFAGASGFALLRRRPGRFLATLLGAGLVLMLTLPVAATPVLSPATSVVVPGVPAGPAQVPDDATMTTPLLDAPDPERLIEGTPKDAVEEVRRVLFSGAAYPPFEENATLTLSSNIGDVTGDGFDDVLLDQYCTDFQACPAGALINGLNFWDNLISGIPCGPAHRLAVANGKDGFEAWSLNLARPEPPAVVACAQEYVIGILKTPSGARQVLAYRYVVRDATPFIGAQRQFDHILYAIDPTNGKTLWEQVFRGTSTQTLDIMGNHVFDVDTAMITPRIVDEGNASAILLQGVGFRETTATGIVPLVANQPVQILSSREPNDWAARLQAEDGRIVWKENLFTPQGRLRSDATWAAPYAEGPQDSPTGRLGHYWRPTHCCGDINADGIEDIAYRIRESSATPTTNPDGPKFVDYWLATFDGANGRPLYKVRLAKDLPRDIDVQLQSLGDVNGDDADDIGIVKTANWANYSKALQVVDGRNGAEIWSHQTPRNFGLWHPGDANDDGAGDILMLEWFDHPSFTALIDEPYTNVTKQTLRLYSGADGRMIWQTHTVAAAIDVVQTLDLLSTTGFPDLDADGIGDVPVDRPLFLPDLTVIHQHTFLSGRTAKPLFSFVTAGAFAFPVGIGDVDRDGHADFGLLNGDILDLWFSAYDGQTGEALWSRRVFAPRLTEYFLALPLMRTESLATHLGPGVLGNFQLNVETLAETIVYGVTINGEGIQQTQQTRITAVYPRVAVFGGTTGDIPWTMPQFYGENASLLVEGATPSSALYTKILEAESKGLSGSVFVLSQAIAVAIASGSMFLGAASGFFTTRRFIR